LRTRILQTLFLATLLPTLGTGKASAQLTLNEQQAAVGDAPSDPDPLVSELSPSLTHESVRRAMRMVAAWQVRRVCNTPSQDWIFATLYMGLLAASRTLQEPRYHDLVLRVAEHYDWRLGPRLDHADDQAIGQVYLALYRERPNPRRIKALRMQFDLLMQEPRKPKHPVWWWCDALFMAPPVWAGLAGATGDDHYLAYMDQEWHTTSSLLWDQKERLFSRDAAYLTKYETNGHKLFWSRGNGWVMGGLVGILQQFAENDPRRPFYVERLQEMASAVKDCQEADGLWRAGMLDAASYANPEISGSAFFVYSIAWGIQHGLLDKATYLLVVQRAWAGMLKHIYADGRLGDVQPVGEAPGNYKPSASYVFGVGAFLLAGSELDTLATSGRYGKR